MINEVVKVRATSIQWAGKQPNRRKWFRIWRDRVVKLLANGVERVGGFKQDWNLEVLSDGQFICWCV